MAGVIRQGRSCVFRFQYGNGCCAIKDSTEDINSSAMVNAFNGPANPCLMILYLYSFFSMSAVRHDEDALAFPLMDPAKKPAHQLSPL
jgi:hypothetical protein